MPIENGRPVQMSPLTGLNLVWAVVLQRCRAYGAVVQCGTPRRPESEGETDRQPSARMETWFAQQSQAYRSNWLHYAGLLTREAEKQCVDRLETYEDPPCGGSGHHDLEFFHRGVLRVGMQLGRAQPSRVLLQVETVDVPYR